MSRRQKAHSKAPGRPARAAKERAKGKPTPLKGRRQAAPTEGVLSEVQIETIRPPATRDWEPPKAVWKSEQQEKHESEQRQREQAELDQLCDDLEKKFPPRKRAADPLGVHRFIGKKQAKNLKAKITRRA